MKKLIFLFLIINSSLFAQHTNVFRDSTVFTKALIVPQSANTNLWRTTGNAGTNPATNFIGTTDNQPLFIKSDSVAIISYKGFGALIGVGNTSPFGGSDSTAFIRGNIAAISAITETNITSPILSITVDTTQIYNQLILDNGTQGAGKVLTSDADGLASWGITSFTTSDSATIYALTPANGTTYFCSNCSGDGITGRIVSYFGSLWRRLKFD